MPGYEGISAWGMRVLVPGYEDISAWGMRVLVPGYEDISAVVRGYQCRGMRVLVHGV